MRGCASRRVPASADLADWLSKYWGPRERLANGPLFTNGRGRFSHWALQSRWGTACKVVGVKIGLYEGTKHSFATAVTALGAPERALPEMQGHADVRSTRLYAQLGSDALVRVVDLFKKR